MFYLLTCITCGNPVGHLFKKYQELLQKYNEHPELDNMENITTAEAKALYKLITEHGFDGRKYCCRRTLLCNYDITSMVS